MINSVSTYLYPASDGKPIVAIHREHRSKFYPLTRASASRLAGVVRRTKGYTWVDGLGWLWVRKAR